MKFGQAGRVLVAIGSAPETDITLAVGSKAAGLIFKPFSLSVLSAEVSRAIG